MKWYCKKIEDLSPQMLFRLMKLRVDVFVMEQACLYHELDDLDEVAYHFYAEEKDQPMAYARLLPPGTSYPEASIGRVLVAPDHRKKGLGLDLMKGAIEATRDLFQVDHIRIGAQVYLLEFYKGLGFEPASPYYVEDGIPHVEMLLKLSGEEER